MSKPSQVPKDSSSDSRDPALSGLLQSWEVQASLPPGFTQEVHRRIRASHPPLSARNTGLTLVLRFMELFQRPVFAALYIATGILLGSVSGAWRANTKPKIETYSTDLQARYVASIDPYQMQRSRTELLPGTTR